MSEPQTIKPNTWTRIAGTELEVRAEMDGVTALEVEHFEMNGDRYVVVTGFHNSGGPVSVRVPQVGQSERPRKTDDHSMDIEPRPILRGWRDWPRP